jgi:Cof subfamily protein (haloacid dehalogenase superfamily)
MKYNWCVCDMDGTLLNSEDIITEDNEAMLKKLQRSGVEVIIASGRVDLMVKRFIKQLDLKGHIISCNGGLIRNIATGEIVYANVMDKHIVNKVISFCTENNKNFLVYTTDWVYSNKTNPRALKYEELNKILSTDLQLPIKYIGDVTAESLEDMDVLKVLLICDNHEQVELLQNKFSKFDSITVVSSSNGLLDIMACNTSKGKALKILSEKLKVDLNNVIAFGDNYNDIEMLQCVGMPIAMGNSVDELKTVAKYITR